MSAITGDLQSLGIRCAPPSLALLDRVARSTSLTLPLSSRSHGDLLFASYTPKAAPTALSSAPASGAATPAAPPPVTAATLSGKAVPLDVPSSSSAAPTASTSTSNASNDKRVGGHRPWEGVEEEPVDVHWEQRDGKIPRPKGQHGCRCGPKSMCDYCMPLEVRPCAHSSSCLRVRAPSADASTPCRSQPFDAEYHASHNIKHLSYHAHLKKLHASIPTSAQASTYIPPLSQESYRVAVPCSSGSHPSWPAGICTKCQPSAVTLSRQSYRMTDHVEFASPALIDGLLSFWRQTGTQRFGYLLGTYQPYDEVPMGVKAVVEAIHEPPQEPHADGIAVGFPWNEEPKVRALAAACGLNVVGVIFTDLTQDKSSDEAKKQGKVVAKRHANAFFLSSLEVLFAASLQRKYPTASRFSTSGQFSSRFVTCVLSGDIEGSIAVEAYQVSDQATSMLDADMVEASVDPGVVRVKDEGPERYIPDVFYRYKNSYGLEVKESAKPCFPVEYLLVNVTHGFPLKPNPRFVSSTPFVKENRAGLEDQTLARACGALAAQLGGADAVSEIVRGGAGINAQTPSDDELDVVAADKGAKAVAAWLSDWHLLRFLTDCGMFDEVRPLSLFLSLSFSLPLPLVEPARPPSRARADGCSSPRSSRPRSPTSARWRASRRSRAAPRPRSRSRASSHARSCSSSRRATGRRSSSSRRSKVRSCLSPFSFTLPLALFLRLSSSPSHPPSSSRISSSCSTSKESTELTRATSRTYLFLPAAPQPPARDYPGAQQPQQTLDGFDIPPDVDVPPSAAGGGGGFGDEAGAAGGAGGAGAAAGGAGDDGIKVCPHCTFENGPGAGQDCEVCGLPLAG